MALLGRLWQYSPFVSVLGGVGAGILMWFHLPMLLLLSRLRPAGRPLPRPVLMLWLICFDYLDINRGLMIELNNRLNSSLRVPADRCLVMVPRCLQWSDCRQNVVDDPQACSDCGACEITRIKMICQERGVRFSVEAGGTSARNQLAMHRPALVVAVACQREILAGIADSPVPVVAVPLRAGSSPCRNSKVNAAELDWRLSMLTGEV